MDHKYLCGVIQKIEIKENIKILYACESGSRAWGFPSLDSDYDIRFIYQRKSKDYLSIFGKPEDISYPIENDLDVYGWDIRKVLKLLSKNNCTLFEWLQSPICYGDFITFKNDFMPLLDCAPNLRAHMYHYLGLFQGKMEGLDLPTVRLKSFFYMTRSLLSALWIATYQSYAPMEMKHLMILLPPDLVNRLELMILLKSSVQEDFTFVLEKEWISYMKETFFKLKGTVAFIPTMKIPIETIDYYFTQLLEKE